jgi:thiol-disulfide isomerase/thioredoxin
MPRSPEPHRFARQFAPLALAFSLSVAFASVASAAAPALTQEQVRAWNSAALDPEAAATVIPQLRQYLAEEPEETYEGFVRQLLVAAMMTSQQPGPSIVSAADSAARKVPEQRRSAFYGQVAEHLLTREIEPAAALKFAKLSLDYVPQESDARLDAFRAIVRGTLGRAQLANNQAAAALATLEQALPSHPDSSVVLAAIGQTHEKLGHDALASDHYVRSLGVYLGRDTSSAEPLRKLWIKKKGSLAGMDASIAAAKKVSRKRVALDSRAEVRVAPDWTLKDLDGTPVKFASFKGKVVVLDFWGSWCGPCRQELPIFQRAYEKYRGKNVVFLGVNWEQQGPDEERLKRAKDYLQKNNYSFPNVADLDRVAVESYGITGFPTVFLVDRTGKIRYRNTGVSQDIETILSDQIESLLE